MASAAMLDELPAMKEDIDGVLELVGKLKTAGQAVYDMEKLCLQNKQRLEVLEGQVKDDERNRENSTAPPVSSILKLFIKNEIEKHEDSLETFDDQVLHLTEHTTRVALGSAEKLGAAMIAEGTCHVHIDALTPFIKSGHQLREIKSNLSALKDDFGELHKYLARDTSYKGLEKNAELLENVVLERRKFHRERIAALRSLADKFRIDFDESDSDSE
ncbi:hypothetical protein BDV96DRAFT_690236 [Lophiotrema nucula]|uniref:Uncharacterized protein n=1 Tax=Lophiotrema nucula TaxID=690887 RepID=A0A6A5YXS0_9PLEO|nr:hypothetical protein BDV96DRAFT_690236 [Lophiotrema nucula]